MLAGAERMTLRPTLVLRLLVCLLLLPFALGALALAVLMLTSQPAEPVGAAVSAVVGLGLGALFVWVFRRESSRRTTLREDGIEQRCGGREVAIRWDDVSEVWFRAQKVQAGGLLGAAIGAGIDAARKAPRTLNEKSTNVTVTVVGGSGRIRLTSGDKGVVAAFEEILRRVNPRLVAEALRRVGEGGEAQFGKVRLSTAGIAIGRKAPLAFNEAGLKVKGGNLYLQRGGAWLASVSVPIHKVPNAFALVETFERLNSRMPADTALDARVASRIAF